MTTESASSHPVAEARDPQPRHSIIRLLMRLRVELVDALDRELEQFEITAPQLIVLGTVAGETATSPAEICKNISYDPGAMTRMIDRLEQKGLLKRIPNPSDCRATQLALTPAGKALYPQLLAAKDRVQAQFLRGFSKDEVRQLEVLLNRMLANR